MVLETILLAVGPGDADRTDELGEAVVEVAAPADATVVLAHVFTESEYEEVASRLADEADLEGGGPDEVASRHATILELSATLSGADVDHEVRGGVGDHGPSILELAEEFDADRILVGGRRRSPTGKAVFGSTAQEVLLSAPCPVTFVRGSE